MYHDLPPCPLGSVIRLGCQKKNSRSCEVKFTRPFLFVFKIGGSMPRRKNGGWLTRVLSAVLWIAGIYFLFLAAREYYPFLMNDRNLDQLRRETISDVRSEDNKRTRNINWKKLHKINPDIIAWIEVPGTKIDYPVLQCHTWNEYLHKDYRGKDNYLGSIFIQPSTHKDFNTFHTVVFGHNMRNQSMFSNLHRYEKRKFFKKHQKVFIYLPNQEIHSKIYSTYNTYDKSNTYPTEFNSEKEKIRWIENTLKYNRYSVKSHLKANNQIITLSICAGGERHSVRYVVHAVLKDVRHYDQSR